MQQIAQTLALMMLCCSSLACAAEDEAARVSSAHLGFVHPEGVDLAGYSVEEKFSRNVYSFYTFGIPSFAAMGLSYYEQYNGDGFTATAGVGIGFVLYGSAAYQWRTGQRDYFKFGVGLGAGVAYSGALPILSYEHRFDQ